MAKCYFELRKQGARGTDSMAADIMRHLHTRQHLGKAVVLHDRASEMLGPGRKQWLKLSRNIQKQRSATLNADKILKYTHTITRMQHMRFTHKTALEDPEAEVHFLTSEDCDVLPVHCYTLYITAKLELADLEHLIEQLPADALVVDYVHEAPWESLGLRPKLILEQQVTNEWRQMQQFLASHHIAVNTLTRDQGLRNIEALDNALDKLLTVSHSFMRNANEFQRALELARPLRIGRHEREQYDLVVLLAHRVQALSPGVFTQHFLESYNEDDTFFLYDIARKRFVATGESLSAAFARHINAGRHALAKALQTAYSLNS